MVAARMLYQHKRLLFLAGRLSAKAGEKILIEQQW